ncbi:MAG TPA: hypothetical protein VF062_23670 [Candidatus Limnocylindrales bacterium]
MALQAAIDAAQAGPRCLVLGAGTFHATRKQTAGTASIPSLRISSTLAVRGEGRNMTALALLGPGSCSGCSNFPAPAPWQLLAIGNGTTSATGVSVRDLTLDGSQRTNTGEQTHLLQLNGPTQDTVIEDVSFRLPVIGPSAGGDCIRFVGTPTLWVRDTTIRNTKGIDCDRSFVSVQRGVDGLVVESSESVKVGDQAIDFEPTGGPAFECQPIVKNVLMRDLTLRRGTTAGVTVAIFGDGCAVAQNVTLTDSVIDDGGVLIVDVRDVTLSRLHLRNPGGTGAPTVHAFKRVVNLRILDTVIERLAGTGTGNALKVNAQSGAYPTDVLLSGVRVEQATPGTLVHGANLAKLYIINSQLVYTGPAGTDHAVVVTGDTTQPAESPVLVDTSVQGSLAGAVKVGGVFNGPPVLVRVTGP